MGLPEYMKDGVKSAQSNYSLLFNKWVSLEAVSAKGKVKADEFSRLKSEYDKRRALLQPLLEKHLLRRKAVLASLVAAGWHAALLCCKSVDAVICGMGDEHPLENSIRLDHCTGIPVIPASSVKGVARFAAEYDYDAEERVAGIASALFGNQTGVGKVQFWDGFPSKVPGLKVDIINCHYQEYYGDTTGKVAPSDDMDPVPVQFLVLDRGSEFCFPVLTRNKEHLTAAVKSLIEALSDWGVGAKTSVGYGMFTDFKEELVAAAVPDPNAGAGKQARKAFEALSKSPSPENFVNFLAALQQTDLKWLSGLDLFAINGFNIGLTEKLVEAETMPLALRKVIAKQFIGKIDLKRARKEAEKKGSSKDLVRHEALTRLLN